MTLAVFPKSPFGFDGGGVLRFGLGTDCACPAKATLPRTASFQCICRIIALSYDVAP